MLTHFQLRCVALEVYFFASLLETKLMRLVHCCRTSLLCFFQMLHRTTGNQNQAGKPDSEGRRGKDNGVNNDGMTAKDKKNNKATESSCFSLQAEWRHDEPCISLPDDISPIILMSHWLCPKPLSQTLSCSVSCAPLDVAGGRINGTRRWRHQMMWSYRGCNWREVFFIFIHTESKHERARLWLS